jgi:hypothetical protein
MASIVAPQDTQRPFAGTGEFFAPQEGHVMEFEDLVAAAMGFDPSAMLGNPTRRGKAMTTKEGVKGEITKAETVARLDCRRLEPGILPV